MTNKGPSAADIETAIKALERELSNPALAQVVREWLAEPAPAQAPRVVAECGCPLVSCHPSASPTGTYTRPEHTADCDVR